MDPARGTTAVDAGAVRRRDAGDGRGNSWLFLPFAGGGPGYYAENREVAYFGILGGVAIAAGIVIFAISPPLLRLMGGVR